MPTSSDVVLTASLDGGAPTSAPAGIAATFSQAVQLSAVNKSTWPGGSATRWEIYDYPDGFALPPGWTEADTGIYYYLGTSDPPAFDVDPWGKYVCRVVVRDTYESQLIISVPSTVLGLKDTARKEGSEFGGAVKQWLADIQANWRIIDAAGGGGGGGGLTSVTTTDSSTLDFSGVGTGGSPLTGSVIAGSINTTQLADGAVTNAKAADMAQATIKGRASGAGTGDPTDLTAAQVRTILNVADGADNSAAAVSALQAADTALDGRLDTIEAGGVEATGAATFSGTGTTTIGDGGDIFFDGTIDAQSNAIGGVADPTAAQDVVTLAYLQANAPVVHARSGSVDFAGASQPWADLGAVIAQAASTATLYELTLQADHGALTGSESILPAMGHRVLHVVTWRNGSSVCAFAYDADETAAPWNVADVEFQLVDSSGNWKIQVRKDVATDQVGTAQARAAARVLSTIPWTSDTTPTLELFGGGGGGALSNPQATTNQVWNESAAWDVNVTTALTVDSATAVHTANTKWTAASTTEVEVNAGLLDLNATGNCTLDAGGTCAITSTGAMTLVGSTINLNIAPGSVQINGVAFNSVAADNAPCVRDAAGNCRFASVFCGAVDQAAGTALALGGTYASAVQIGRSGQSIGEYGGAGTTKPTITGNVTTGTLANLQSVVGQLLTYFAARGTITNSTT